MYNKSLSQVIFCLLCFFISTASFAKRDQKTWCLEKYDTLLREYTVTNFPDWNQIIEQWGAYENECKKTGEYQNYLAVLYLSSGRYKEARILSEEVIEKYSRNFDTRVAERTLVLLDLLEKKVDSALVRSKELIKKYPDWHEGYQMYGGVLLQRGDDLDAEKYLLKANAIEERPITFFKLSKLYLKRKDYKKFLEFYEKSLNESILTLLGRDETFTVASVAIRLNKWAAAENILAAQKYVDKEVVNDERYQLLMRQVEEFKKAHPRVKDGKNKRRSIE